jgi:integrase
MILNHYQLKYSVLIIILHYNIMITDKEFYDHIENTKLLKKNSKLIYVKKLNEIQNTFFTRRPTIHWIMMHPDRFKTALLNYGERSNNGRLTQKLSRNSLSQFIVPIISLLMTFRQIQEKNPEILQVWKKMKDDIIDNEHIMNNEPSERQKKALMTFEEIVKIRDKLDDGSDAKLLISLYTMIPPVRNNFDKIKIYNSVPKDVKGNYIDLKNKIIVINKYKTDKIYGKNEIKIPNNLLKQINISLNKKPREYLFIQSNGELFNSNSWNITANRILKKVLNNNNFSLSMFRHIYLSRKDLNLKDKTLKEKKEIADKMGHSVSTQDKYYWKNEGN